MTTRDLLLKYERQLHYVVVDSERDIERSHGEAREAAARVHNRVRSILGDVRNQLIDRTTVAEHWHERSDKGLWRLARKQHQCANARGGGFNRRGCLGTGVIEKDHPYFDTEEEYDYSFNTLRLCEACANSPQNDLTGRDAASNGGVHAS